MKRMLIIAACLTLAGCFGMGHRPEPIIQTKEVKVPVPVACHATVNIRDTYADDTADQQPDIFEKVKALLIGREERKEDAANLKGAVRGCGGTVQ